MAKDTMKNTSRVEMRKPVSFARPSIDFPVQAATIAHPHYTVRVGAPADARRVEIAINQGAWQPCRPAVGYWWYDWNDIAPGEHEFVVRVQETGGDWLLSETRQCFAAAPDAD